MQDTKKVAGELLVELEKKGVTFETVDGKLKYKDSKGNFTENSKEKVKKYKEEIIEILKKKQTIDEFITDNDYETNVYPLTDVQAAYLVGKTEVGMDQWTWRLTYKVFCGKNIVSTVDSLMSWNYQSVEKILNQLTKMHFRTAKLSETLLLAIKAR